MIKFKVLDKVINENSQQSNWDKIKYFGKKALPYLAGAAALGGTAYGVSTYGDNAEEAASIENKTEESSNDESTVVNKANQLAQSAKNIAVNVATNLAQDEELRSDVKQFAVEKIEDTLEDRYPATVQNFRVLRNHYNNIRNNNQN